MADKAAIDALAAAHAQVIGWGSDREFAERHVAALAVYGYEVRRIDRRRPAPMRLRMEVGHEPELRCPHCGEWWPITPEFWRLGQWHRCNACNRERARLYAAMRHRDDLGYRTKKAVASRRYRNWLKATCPEYLAAYDRERKARNRAYQQRKRDEAA
jgi:hypothetical protein